MDKLANYIAHHTSEDFPMDLTLGEFMEKVKKWSEENETEQ